MLRTTLRRLAEELRPVVGSGVADHPPVWPVPLPAQLPPHAGRPTLVLDIDETLLHTYAMGPAAKGDGGVARYAFVFLPRPHLREFLDEVRELFEVVFWTAGTAAYCSAVVDALEAQVLRLPPSLYGYDAIVRAAQGLPSTSHVNFYALARTQTLEDHHYMKYIPILGRPLHRVIMLDDNERSFPLTPRNGIKIAPFLANDAVMHRYSRAVSLSRGAESVPAELADDLRRGADELARLSGDRALLDLLPLLRAAARADDLPRELDFWRDDEYSRCDDFRETMNHLSVTRTKLLGAVLPERRPSPIAPLKPHVMNHAFTHEAAVFMDELHRRANAPLPHRAKL